MTEKRFVKYDGNTIVDLKLEKSWIISNGDVDLLINLLNDLYDEKVQLTKWYIKCKGEKKEMGEIFEDIFKRIINLPHLKQEYCGALFRLLGEENNVDKTKQRIREFLYEE